jgi:integrase
VPTSTGEHLESGSAWAWLDRLPARAATSGGAAGSWATDAGQDGDRDVVKLQAALLAHGGVLTGDDLADALGWDLQRLDHGLGALRDRLRPTGLRLRRAGWNSYALTPAPAALSSRVCQRLHGAAGAPALPASVERHPEHADQTKAIDRAAVERLLTRRDIPLREKTLWRLLYETAARASEVLALGPRNVAVDESLAGGITGSVADPRALQPPW